MNHHFRSYSEQLQPSLQNQNQNQTQNQHQHQHQHQQHILINQSNTASSTANNNNNNNNNQLQADQQATNQGSIIRIHSDSQQSLDRLFNPTNTQATVPLRNRNLPASFFNPTWQTTSRNNNNNSLDDNNSTETKPLVDSNGSSDNLNKTNGSNNTNNNLHHHQQHNFHNRSVSLFVPRGSSLMTTQQQQQSVNNNNNNLQPQQQQQQQTPAQGLVMPQHTNLHTRTRSTLAPMTGAVGQRITISSQTNDIQQQQFVNNNGTVQLSTNNNPQLQQPQQPQPQHYPNLHNRSISMFDQRPRDGNHNMLPLQQPMQAPLLSATHQNGSLHMRSGSGLAPMPTNGIQSPISGSNQYLNNNDNNHQPIAQQQQMQPPPAQAQQQASQEQQFSYYPTSNQNSSTTDLVGFGGNGNGAGGMNQCFMQQEPISSPNYIANSDPIQQQFHITHSQPYIPYNPSLSTSSGSLNPTTASSTSSSSNENNSLLDIANGGGASSTIVHTVNRSSWFPSGHQQDIYFEYQ